MAVKECCEKAENLVVRVEDQDRPNVVVRRCKVCNCRHIEMVAEPGVIGLRGADV